MPVSNGFTYTTSGSDATITDYDPSSSTYACTPTIPPTLDGYNVIEVAANAMQSKSLCGLTINHTIELNNYSFSDNSGMEVNLNANVTTGGVTSALNSPFLNCNIGNGLTIGNSVTTISLRLFGVAGITSLNLNNITLIERFGFFDNSISTLSIDNNTQISYRSFYNNSGISLTLNADLLNYDMSDTTSTPFESCSLGSNLTINSGCTQIGAYVFKNCGLTDITFDYDLAVGNNSFAYNSGLTVNLNHNIDTYAVTSTGYGAFENCSIGGNLTIGNDVTTITERAFCYSGLTSLNLNNISLVERYGFLENSISSLTIDNNLQVSYYSFYNNAGLTLTLNADLLNYDMSDTSNTPFRNCSIANNLTINSGCTQIGAYTFKNCGLSSVTFDYSLDLGNNAFASNGLLTVTMNTNLTTSVTSNSYSPFESCTIGSNLTIHSSVTIIDDYLFGNANISSVTLPSSLLTIGDYSFNNNSLVSLTLLNTLTSIGNYGLANNSLTSINLPSSLTSIGYAGIYNNALSSVTFDYSVQLEGRAFASNGSITVTVNADVTTTGITSSTYSVFDNCSIGSNLTLTTNVTALPDYLFSDSGITSLTLPSTLTSIGISCFEDNSISALTFDYTVDLYSNAFKDNDGIDLTINANLTTNGITDYTDAPFYSCSIGSDLTIGASVTNLATYLLAYSGINSFTPPSNITTYYSHCLYANSITSLTFDYDCILYSKCFANNSLDSLIINAVLSTSGISDKDYSPFYHCYVYENLTLQSGMTDIGDYALANAGILFAVLPSTLTSIGKYSFAYNYIPEITLPNTLTYIDVGGLANNNIYELDIDYAIDLDENAFANNGGMILNLNADVTTSNITSSSTPVFEGCILYDNVEIGGSVTAIPNYLFANSGMIRLRIPNNVLTIGTESMAYNEGLRKLYVYNDSITYGTDCLYDNMSPSNKGLIYGNLGSTSQTYAGLISNYDFAQLSGAATGTEIVRARALYHINNGEWKRVRI